MFKRSFIEMKLNYYMIIFILYMKKSKNDYFEGFSIEF